MKQKHNDEEPDTQEAQQDAETDGEMHATENGTKDGDEQEVPCNGEVDAAKEVESDHVPAIKQETPESYENSLDGLQKMLGYNISEEVEKQKEHGSDKRKKKHLSESSDTNGKTCGLNSLYLYILSYCRNLLKHFMRTCKAWFSLKT